MFLGLEESRALCDSLNADIAALRKELAEKIEELTLAEESKEKVANKIPLYVFLLQELTVCAYLVLALGYCIKGS